MAHQIRDEFINLLNLENITEDQVKMMIKYIISYELRDSNPQAFNTYSLGLHKCLFTDSDRDGFIDLFVVDGKSTNANEINTAMKRVAVIDAKYMKVISDVFNLFITYLIHCILVSKAIRNEKTRQEGAQLALKFLQYKFFTSLVNYYFPFQPNEGVMRAMFENLSNKYEIKVYGTWSKVLAERAKQLLSQSSIHYKSLINFNDDKAIVYFISDTQTRVRSQINNVTTAFYAAKETNDTILTYGSIGTNKEGESGLIDRGNMLDSAILNIYNDCMSVTKFLDAKLMRIVSSQFNAINPTVFKSFLIAFSEYAVKCTKDGTSRKVTPSPEGDVLTGPEILVNTIIQQCYRFCVSNRIDTRRPILVMRAIRDVFSSSRVSDENILQIKRSMTDLVLKLQDNRRDIIMSGLRISFVLYLILLSFKYTGVFNA